MLDNGQVTHIDAITGEMFKYEYDLLWEYVWILYLYLDIGMWSYCSL